MPKNFDRALKARPAASPRHAGSGPRLKTNDPNGSPLRLRNRSCDQLRLRRACPSGPELTLLRYSCCAYQSCVRSLATGNRSSMGRRSFVTGLKGAAICSRYLDYRHHRRPGHVYEDARNVPQQHSETEGFALDSRSPQTVLKTAGLASAAVHQGPLELNRGGRQSAVVRSRPQSSASLAVILAVIARNAPCG